MVEFQRGLQGEPRQTWGTQEFMGLRSDWNYDTNGFYCARRSRTFKAIQMPPDVARKYSMLTMTCPPIVLITKSTIESVWPIFSIPIVGVGVRAQGIPFSGGLTWTSQKEGALEESDLGITRYFHLAMVTTEIIIQSSGEDPNDPFPFNGGKYRHCSPHKKLYRISRPNDNVQV
ncbi:hypothetical protein CPB84DRAFT_647695 [Gymnopilus junonius]|uniref:Uncharacterized protein n=1 Tax=Gymnopilus junonius TaxID=109634 RepID=A0A9P5N942_GYMJU|nr:hypothetical protein CPB84DRAFT_647695 [Gymnopilus junonius]